MRVDRVEPDPEPVVGLVVVVASRRPMVPNHAVDDEVVLRVDLGHPTAPVDTLHPHVAGRGPAVVPQVQHELTAPPRQRTDVADLGALRPLCWWRARRPPPVVLGRGATAADARTESGLPGAPVRSKVHDPAVAGVVVPAF